MATKPRIGAAIRRARERKRMRQQDLADALGVSRVTVDAWENDRAYPRSSIGALEEVLGISLDGEPQPGPLDDLKPWHEDWEAQVAADTTLPAEDRRWLITESRAARARRAARHSARREAETEGRSGRAAG